MRYQGFLIPLSLALISYVISAPVQSDEVNTLAQDNAQVQVLLDEIRLEGLKKHNAFADYSPAKSKDLINSVTFDDGTEASVNRKIYDYLFENDIVLTIPQAQTILSEIKNGKNERPTRQAQPGANYLWKNYRVPYMFKFADDEWQKLIRRAQDHIESETCMRFVYDETAPDRLEYTRAGGCWSNVGRIGGRQTVSIGYGCDALGIVAHESLHALGLWHEQSRYDRDGFIKIDFGFIFPGTQSNFEKRTPKTSDNYGQPYDLGSVMHYGPKAFSTDYDRNTIVTKDPLYQKTIGQRIGISFKDARMINIRYCDAVCSKKLDCQNGGYTDPNDCSKCKCPRGLGGKLCDDVAYTANSECVAGEYTAQSNWQTLTSPSPLTPSLDCFWRLTAQPGERVEIEFLSNAFPCNDACTSFVEVKYLADKTTTGAHICCLPPDSTILSEDEFSLLYLHTESDLVPNYLGFNIRYRSVPQTAKPSIIPTTTTTTTQRTTTYGRGDPNWSEWGGWSQCSVRCGGCGERVRVRACYGGNGRCSGSDTEKEPCGQDPCSAPKAKTTRCKGRLVLPCDLLDELDFGTVNSNPVLQQTARNTQILKRARREVHERRVKRFVDGNKQMEAGDFCEKRFSYNCPTSLLTINIDRRSQDPAASDGLATCCPNYYRSQGKCVKGKNLTRAKFY